MQALKLKALQCPTLLEQIQGEAMGGMKGVQEKTGPGLSKVIGIEDLDLPLLCSHTTLSPDFLPITGLSLCSFHLNAKCSCSSRLCPQAFPTSHFCHHVLPAYYYPFPVSSLTSLLTFRDEYMFVSQTHPPGGLIGISTSTGPQTASSPV